ncbi:MAG: methyltransferase domain-containing protein, partial [Lachnospiraceae bacterium]|nr:methyltransferase domain-containing protein [Lachnospiraceae bacterium]
MPLWRVVHFRETYGTDACEKILAASLERQPVSLRLKEGISAEERSRLFAAWEAAGVTVRQHPYHPCAVTVQGAAGIRKLAGYDEGLFAVQDVSSILAVEAAGISPGDTVIDVCAAPGGKALFAAQKLEKSGEVIACDVSDFKTDKIEENRRRLGVENVSVLVQDARSRNESLVGRADVLMADVPCSGLGVIGHKQDIKYRVTRESLEEILVLQKDIITNVIDYIKPGGTLLYSTCTLNPGENEEMVEWICQNFGLERVSMAGQLPDALKVEAESGMLQLLPGIHETDGFFMAKLLKKE